MGTVDNLKVNVSERAYSIEDFGPNAGYVEELLKLYQSGSPLLDGAWRKFFGGDNATNGTSGAVNREFLFAQIQVLQLIQAYRKHGHLAAKTNPLKYGSERDNLPDDLIFEKYQFDSAQLQQNFFSFGLAPESQSTPAQIYQQLQRIYCGSVGFEFEHIGDKAIRDWMSNLAENDFSKVNWFDTDSKLRYLDRLVEAESFDMFLHTRFIGAKRFSILGAETFVVLLQRIIESSAKLGVEDIVLAMAHRGRLNAVATFAGKPIVDLISEFEDTTPASKFGGGDVKYHLGSSMVHEVAGKKVRFSLPPNPSHLDFVNPVANGMVRATQENKFPNKREAALSLSVHGDASFAGQGIVAEAFNFSRLSGYETRGTIHIIINNQIGFTTYCNEGRSTTYCTDLAKGYDVPVFHINGDDIEACAWAADAALRFRQEFKRDVVIDLICSRKFGHNEGDDPTFTQPLMYKELSSRSSPATMYAQKLVSDKVITQTEADRIKNEVSSKIKSSFESASGKKSNKDSVNNVDYSIVENNKTAVKADILNRIAASLLPDATKFEIHPKLKGILSKRQQALNVDHGIDWGLAEALSFGSLLFDGISIRLSGQDSGRGTFSHRHLELHNYSVDGRFLPLNELAIASKLKAKFQVYNSPLSESAVMAFDFGYSVQDPQTLVLWEAQFGDFVNGAQVIIDQFISSSEQKWNQRSGLVLLLPHGFEGMGPEHSSARLERFLQLCSNNNMTVAYPTSPAQYFHLLRRQSLSETKRPLIIMTPKSMLRLAEAGSSLADLTSGQFEKVISVGKAKDKNQAVVFCSGKVFYELKKVIGDQAKIVRIEQLYPWPQKEIKAALGTASKVYWVQEEPENMGAARYVEPLFAKLGVEVTYFGRESAAGVATGSPSWHLKEEKAFLDGVVKALKKK